MPSPVAFVIAHRQQVPAVQMEQVEQDHTGRIPFSGAGRAGR
jgi:hypothetical protein